MRVLVLTANYTYLTYCTTHTATTVKTRASTALLQYLSVYSLSLLVAFQCVCLSQCSSIEQLE
jgi:hypothetical protein